MQPLLERIIDGAATASIVKQAVGAHHGTVHHLLAAGDAAWLGTWGTHRLRPVPAAWTGSLRLHGVLSGGELLVSAGAPRRMWAVGAGKHPRELGELAPGTNPVAAGDDVLLHGPGGLRSSDGRLLFSREVAAVSPAYDGVTLAVLTKAAEVWLLPAGGEPALVLAGDAALRPVKAELCACGGHLAVVVRTPTGRRVRILRDGGPLAELGGATDLLAFQADCSLVTVDDSWPVARLRRTGSDGATRDVGAVHGAVTALLSSSRGVYAHVSSPDRPPSALPVSELVSAAGAQPVAGEQVATRHGGLRVLRGRPTGARTADVVLLHGGPHGMWTPCWDPIVDLLDAAGLRVHRLEAPYTAALAGRHTAIGPGSFGVTDAESVADAIGALPGPAPLVVGHSYGGFLGVRAAQLLPGGLGGLFLMGSVWRGSDLEALRDDPRSSGSPLGAFLRHAFPPGTPVPDAELPAGIPVSIVHGELDPVVPLAVATAAAAASPHASLTVLAGEGHVPRGPAAVTRVLRGLTSWIERTRAHDDHR